MQKSGHRRRHCAGVVRLCFRSRPLAQHQPVRAHCLESPGRLFQKWYYPDCPDPDVYLWLGTDFGLLRFDGVRFVAWQPPGNEHLPSNAIAGLLVSSDGTLWIGTQKGLASWKDSRLNHYSELDGQLAFRFLEDQEHTIWVGSIGIPTGRLCMVVVGLYEDSKRNLWVGVSEGLWRWIPGPSKFYPMPGESNGIRAFIEDDLGLLISTREGIKRFVDGKTEAYPPLENIG